MKKIKTSDAINLSVLINKAKETTKKVCILSHGITADKSEGGIYNRLASELNKKGFDTVQFDFRGHGGSDGESKGMTISGETLDLTAVIEYCLNQNYTCINLISASFGAVSTSNLSSFIKSKISKVVLWNPVLDLEKTFIAPILPWGKKSFNQKSFQRLKEKGSLFIDDSFEISSVLIEEFKLYKVNEKFKEFDSELLIVHGNKDTYVSYEISKRSAMMYPRASFITVDGAEHGFGRDHEEKFVINETISFLN